MRYLSLLAIALLFTVNMVLSTVPGRAEGFLFIAEESPIRISQVYGAGGNQGALWLADFIELFNATESPVLLDGWAVEYAPVGSTNWQRTRLDQAVLEPYSYLLVGQAAGSSGVGAELPEPDIQGSINLNASNGKVRLVNDLGVIIDLLGYGSADEYEGSDPSPALSATRAALRKEGGCIDTNQNQADFVLESPNPRNSSSPTNPCSGEVVPTETPTEVPVETPTPHDEPTSEVPTDTPLVTDTPLAPSPTPIPTTLFISEFLADPAAVDDNAGEWVELYNPGPESINLRGWTLADLKRDRHLIDVDLQIAPDAYVVLARNGDPAVNGGVIADYVYRNIALANKDDELLLISPEGVEVDRVVWGPGTGLTIRSGASLYRSHFGPDAPWLTATTPWPGSLGDFGHPGSPPPSGMETPTPTATEEPPPAGTPTDTPTPSPTPTAPTLFISEFIADPDAVTDANGEWFELYNPGPDSINLRGWTLTDQERDRHTISSDLWMLADTYTVLARNGNPAENGGVAADYVYRSITLGNSDDRLVLLDPQGREVDRVAWGPGSGLAITAGASLERAHFGPVAQWQTAAFRWNGSAGDRGSPGGPYVSPSQVTPTPTPALELPAPTPTPTRPPAGWLPVESPASLQIEEVHFRGSGAEYIVLLNVGTEPLDLTGWRVGDAHLPGVSEGIYALPEGYLLAPGLPFVIARNGTDFLAQWARLPAAQFESSAVDVPVLVRQRELSTGTFALNDSGDEVVLLNPAGQLADAVAYGNGDAAAVGLAAALSPVSGLTLHRVPGYSFPTTRDPRHRFLWAPPDPFGVQRLPPAQPSAPVPLAHGMVGIWGSLAVASTFSPGGIAPPHLLESSAAAGGLHFIVVADNVNPAYRTTTNAPILSLPAWRWQGGDRNQAIVYGPYFHAGVDPLSLLDGLSTTNGIAQWSGSNLPDHRAVVALAADAINSPSALFSQWRNRKHNPPLPGGNATPPLPGYLDSAPRYTGLAVHSLDETGVLEALRNRRGWLATTPGLVLTLHSGDGTWMGSAMPVAGESTLHIRYSDATGELAGLALWQDNQPIRQLDLPPADGHWQITIPTLPDTLLYAVATQADGDFAVTAPLRVMANETSQIRINEVMPVPISDWNGDGVVNSGDEYIELYNAGPAPISLAGWVLEDRPLDAPSARRRFTLGAQHFLGVGDHLLIWGTESYIGLNNRNERLDLFDSDGNLVDFVEWTNSPGGDRTLSRVPDGGGWQIWPPTPGRSNGNFAPAAPVIPTPPAWQVAGSAAPGTPGGEAVGPSGSVTNAKLAGLGERVRFVGVVIAPPGLFNSAIYVADPAAPPAEETAAVGIQVYLQKGEFPPLEEGDQVDVQGVMHSFRGEREIRLDAPEQIWRIGPGASLLPLPIAIAQIGESLEGRLVTFEGIVTGFQGESILLADPDDPTVESIPVTVRSSLSWRRPFVNNGERWRVIGIVGQFAQKAPWNGGYRVLVRYPEDLVRLTRAP
jgi:hypothetical protein